MIDHAGNKLIPDQYIQTADTIENTTDYYDDGHKLCTNWLTYLDHLNFE